MPDAETSPKGMGFFTNMTNYPCIHLNKAVGGENNLYSLNLILSSMEYEEMDYLPIQDIMQFEKCIKKGQVCFEFPEGKTIMDKLTLSLFIWHLAHCFLLMDIYTVADLLERDVVEKFLKNDFDLTYDEFKSLWNGFSTEYKCYIEKSAQFYYDSFFCTKLKKFPSSSLYAKWVLGNNYSVVDKNYSSFKSIVIK